MALLILAIVPSIALTAQWALNNGRVWTQWNRTTAAGHAAKDIGFPAYQVMVSLQAERRLTDAANSSPSAPRKPLHAQRERTDRALAAFRSAADQLSAEDTPRGFQPKVATARKSLRGLAEYRADLDSGRVPRGESFSYYTVLVENHISLFEALGQVDADADVVAAYRPLVGLYWATEMISREDALLSRGWPSGRLTSDEYTQFAGWLGVQRFYISTQISPYLPPADKGRFDMIVGGAGWGTMSVIEDAVVRSHLDNSTPGAALPTGRHEDWRDGAGNVTNQLQALNVQRTEAVAKSSQESADQLLSRLITNSALGLLAVILVILISLRLAAMLRRRITVLREESLAFQERLPEVVDRLQRGLHVDTAEEIPEIQQRDDELGRLGEALNTARRTAVETAIQQAEQHRGFEKLLQRIARRTQLLIGLQLKKLDEMERKHENAEVLEGLFDLDHLTARLRRYEENLVILGGGQPQRRWRKPARLLDVLRSSQGEVQDYTRIQIEVAGRVWIDERAVGTLVHVVAELMENAASFSKPPTPVEVRAAAVGRGVAIEIEDRGLGMEAGQYRAANAMMANPPRPDVLSRVDDIRLGLYVVARLAVQLGLQVEFRPSAFGGTRVIVLVPGDLIVQRPEPVALPVGERDGRDGRDGLELSSGPVRRPVGVRTVPVPAVPTPVVPNAAVPTPGPAPDLADLPDPAHMPDLLEAADLATRQSSEAGNQEILDSVIDVEVLEETSDSGDHTVLPDARGHRRPDDSSEGPAAGGDRPGGALDRPELPMRRRGRAMADTALAPGDTLNTQDTPDTPNAPDTSGTSPAPATPATPSTPRQPAQAGAAGQHLRAAQERRGVGGARARARQGLGEQRSRGSGRYGEHPQPPSAGTFRRHHRRLPTALPSQPRRRFRRPARRPARPHRSERIHHPQPGPDGRPQPMTQRTTATHQDLDWLLDGLLDKVIGAQHALVLSDDGLVISKSAQLERADAEHLAAVATGQQSLARSVGVRFGGGPVHQVIVEMADLWLFITAAGSGSHLAVIASQEVDAEVMAMAMHTLVQQVGLKLGSPARQAGSADGSAADGSTEGVGGGGHGALDG
jgi:predicted regulator of Ras-like GTPase activity (Roadblock/LC7/MglB family)